MRKNLEIFYQDINRHYIRMKKIDTKHNTEVVFSLLNKLIEIMCKSNKLFKRLNPSLEFLGSYFDRVRVGMPTEYDINIMLSVPVKYETIKLDATKSMDDYTNIIMPSEFRRLSITPAAVDKGFIETKSWCNKHYCLSVIKFRTWMQSVLDNALNTLPLDDGKRVIKIKNKYWKISTRQSGPANTLLISYRNTAIDIDLVPTFSFDLPIQPLNSKVQFDKVEATGILKYFVVPKPIDDDYSWRLTFPFQERHFLKNKDNLKSTIRLLKHFRDVQEFKKLSSYYIKTLFLWECSRQDGTYWQKNSLSDLVLHMLKKLKECLIANNIPNFWCPSHNLLNHIKPETCRNWSNRISYVISKIENVSLNNHSIQEYFAKKTC